MTKEQLGKLILSSERQMYLTAKTILHNDQDCADAIQEAIVKAFQKIDTLQKDRYAKTWLIRILIHECYNLLRKESSFVPLEKIPEGFYGKTVEKEDYSELYLAVSSLKDELRIPVILYMRDIDFILCIWKSREGMGFPQELPSKKIRMGHPFRERFQR